MPTFSPSLEKALHKALTLANERHHEYATLEHLLLALIEDSDAAAVMGACNVNLDQLRAIVTQYIDNELQNLVTGYNEDSKPTSGFQRVIQRAVIHVQSSDSPQSEWIQSTQRLMAAEARQLRPGGETVITRLADILVIQAIRAWIDADPAAQSGWLGALKDRQIGHALTLIHRNPTDTWTVARLADECAMSRSAFAACLPSSTYSALTDGAHNFSVRATDPAGNVDATPATYSWVVDTSTPLDCGPQITLSASADAWVDQGSPSSNKGSDSILKVMSKSSNNLRAFVQFNLPVAPQGCVVQSATLRLYAASSRTGRTLQALQVHSSWTENSVTWNNQPATTGAAATTSSGIGWREWNVAAIVQAMYDSGMNNGFLLRDATENNDAEQQFHGREKGESIPQLLITFGPAP